RSAAVLQPAAARGPGRGAEGHPGGRSLPGAAGRRRQGPGGPVHGPAGGIPARTRGDPQAPVPGDAGGSAAEAGIRHRHRGWRRRAAAHSLEGGDGPMTRGPRALAVIAVLIGGLVLFLNLFVFEVNTKTQAVIRQFGQVVRTVEEPGWYVRIPVLQRVVLMPGR